MQSVPTIEPTKRTRRSRVHVKRKQYGIRLGDQNIRRRFADPQAARRWQEDMRREYERRSVGILEPSQPILFSQAVERFKAVRQGGSGFKIEAVRWDTYVLPKFARRHLHEISFEEWRHFFGDKKNGELGVVAGTLKTEHDLSPQTSNMIKNQVNLLYKWAIRQTDITCDKNPVSGIANQRIPRQGVEHLASADQVHRYLAAAQHGENPPEWPITAMLLCNTGQRIGQVRGIRWEDVDFDGSILHLRWKWCPNRVAFVPGSKKGDGEFHWIWMQPALKAALFEWKMRTRWNRPTDFVCANQMTGKSIEHSGSAWYCHRRTLARAGLPEMKIHALRHSYATLYLEHGGNIHDLKEILNHSSIMVTEKYNQYNKERLKKASSVLTFAPLSPQGLNVTDIRTATTDK